MICSRFCNAARKSREELQIRPVPLRRTICGSLSDTLLKDAHSRSNVNSALRVCSSIQ